METATIFKDPQVWGGIECTINRVGNVFKDQLEYSGHYERFTDLEKISELGIKAIRYPVLWEKHQPHKNYTIDWTWADRQLQFIRSSEMTPVIGLMHHGSGPSFTSLLDPEFPQLLAAYAFEVASRYPWLEYYTPVNEPLTTARFSGLYGLWYPHHKKELSFYRMLLNQLKGTVLAMEAIRSVNLSAKLVQTEDLGKTHSTSLLKYQANFENDRRLLTFDILTGRLNETHPQFDYMIGCGIRKEEIEFFQRHKAEPYILGLNYYVTSERWLDESLEKYPVFTHGGNEMHGYADTEMVRAEGRMRSGLICLATEIWDRYHIALAVTEVHLHCTREEQLRWFKEIWDQSVTLTRNGIEVKGVTAWALLGSFDWNSLLTKTGTQYESGAFDIKTLPGELRPTALSTLLRTITASGKDFHPVLSANGWWCPQAGKNNKEGVKRVVILQGDQSDADFEVKILAAKIQNACNQRRIENNLTQDIGTLKLDQGDVWAVITTSDRHTSELGDFCSRNQIQYVTFSRNEEFTYGLKIMVNQEFITQHEINKVLDLMIDGDQGCWIFDRSEIIFKMDEVMAGR